MKVQTFIVLLLVFCLAGCSSQDTVQAPIAPTEIPTTPHATQSPTTESTIPPHVIIQPEPSDDDFVMVKTYIPDIFVELHYSTQHNFTNQKIYDFADAWLRYGTVKKLISVQEELKQNGLSLKIWDSFRPPAAQFKLWDVYPDPTYVFDPNNGFSSHSCGNTIDVTLVYADGTELDMPTEFDDFSKLADRDYRDCSKETAANATLLEELMKKYGFHPYFGEWWHFSDTQSYPVDESFEPVEATTYRANYKEYVSLQAKPNTTSDVIAKIPFGEQFHVVAEYDDFVLIKYAGLWGYVLRNCIQPVR